MYLQQEFNTRKMLHTVHIPLQYSEVLTLSQSILALQSKGTVLKDQWI